MIFNQQRQQQLLAEVSRLSTENALLKEENSNSRIKLKAINKALDKAMNLWTDDFTFAQVIIPQKVRQTLLNIKNGDNPDTFV